MSGYLRNAIYDEDLEDNNNNNCRFSSFLSHDTALTWSAAEPSHRFVTGFSHRSVIFLGDRVRAAPGSGRQQPSAEAPAVTESQRWRATALRVSAPNADSGRVTS